MRAGDERSRGRRRLGACGVVEPGSERGSDRLCGGHGTQQGRGACTRCLLGAEVLLIGDLGLREEHGRNAGQHEFVEG
ncbi:MAG: hypothetical protein ACYTFT_13920, partial [Planctomycetota bacterium]